MPTDYYTRKKDKTVDLDMPKFLIIVITVFVTVIIPVQFIAYFQKNPDQLNEVVAQITGSRSKTNQLNNGRVAGVSTSNTPENDVLGGIFNKINLEDKSTQYLLLGGFFITLSVLIIAYLLSTEKKPKKHYYAKNKFEYY